MNQGPAGISNKVTVLVFKDNYAARTFQIPLSWISKFGIFLGILVGLTSTSIFLAVKYYQVALKTDPSRVQDLEQELVDLRTSQKNIETKGTDSPAAPSSTSHAPSTPGTPVATESPANPKTSDSVPAGEGSPLVFSGFPAQAISQAPAPSTLSFAIQSQKATWIGRNLRVQFALQYTKQDQGNQQGRIVILARGPENLLAYPAGVFNSAGSGSLIDPDKGEFFSVGRFREVKADFGPLRTQQSISLVEVFIFSKDGQILAYEKILPGVKKGTPAPRSPAPAESSASSSGNAPAAPPVEAPKAAETKPEAPAQTESTPPSTPNAGAQP